MMSLHSNKTLRHPLYIPSSTLPSHPPPGLISSSPWFPFPYSYHLLLSSTHQKHLHGPVSDSWILCLLLLQHTCLKIQLVSASESEHRTFVLDLHYLTQRDYFQIHLFTWNFHYAIIMGLVIFHCVHGPHVHCHVIHQQVTMDPCLVLLDHRHSDSARIKFQSTFNFHFSES